MWEYVESCDGHYAHLIGTALYVLCASRQCAAAEVQKRNSMKPRSTDTRWDAVRA